MGRKRTGGNTHLTLSARLVGCRKSWAPPRTSTWPHARSKSCLSLTAGGHRTASSFSPSRCPPWLCGPCLRLWVGGMRPKKAEAWAGAREEDEGAECLGREGRLAEGWGSSDLWAPPISQLSPGNGRGPLIQASSPGSPRGAAVQVLQTGNCPSHEAPDLPGQRLAVALL